MGGIGGLVVETPRRPEHALVLAGIELTEAYMVIDVAEAVVEGIAAVGGNVEVVGEEVKAAEGDVEVRSLWDTYSDLVGTFHDFPLAGTVTLPGAAT